MEKGEFLKRQEELAEEGLAEGIVLNGAQSAKAIARMTSQMHQIAKTAVNMENLTGDPLWDEFLAILQAVRNDTEKVYDDFRNKADNPLLTNIDYIMSNKILMAVARERMAVLDLVALIPVELKKKGEVSKKLLAQLPVISDEPAKKRSLFGRRN